MAIGDLEAVGKDGVYVGGALLPFPVCVGANGSLSFWERCKFGPGARSL